MATTVSTTASSVTTSQQTTTEKTTQTTAANITTLATTREESTTTGVETTTTTAGEVTTSSSSATETTTTTKVETVVKVDVSEKAEVDAQRFTDAAQKGETLVLEADNYQWSFAADQLTATDMALNTAIYLGDDLPEQDAATLKELNQDETVFPFSFEHHGALPGEAVISIQVDAAFAEKTVDIYSVNADGKAVFEGRGTVSAEGELIFTTNHCSLWFIKEADQSTGVWLYVILGAAAVLIGGAVAAFVLWKKKRA